jgi:hypothetical protein
MIILRDVYIIKISDAEIENGIQHERKIKKRKIKSEIFCLHFFLPMHINKKYMKWLDK